MIQQEFSLPRFQVAVEFIPSNSLSIKVFTKKLEFSNTFLPDDLETITTKTGNFKKFSLFVEMLFQGLKNSSNDSPNILSVEIKTLEEIKGNSKTTNFEKIQKIYLILVYEFQYDKVYYPLVLKRNSLIGISSNIQDTPNKAELNLLKQNLKLKQMIQSNSAIMSEVKQQTKAEFKKIKDELYHLILSSTPSKDLLEEQLGKCFNLVESLLEELRVTKINYEKTLKQKDLEIENLQRGRPQQTNQRKQRTSSVASNRSIKTTSTTADSIRSCPSSLSNASRSSAFKRFDPTAYVEEQKRKKAVAASKSRSSSATKHSYRRIPGKENAYSNQNTYTQKAKDLRKELDVDEIDVRLDILQKYFKSMKMTNN